MISGIDISRYQGVIDWAKVAAAGYKFAIIRCSVGNYYVDPMFEANWDGAKAAGLQVGAYHVVRADNSVDSQLLKLRGILDGNDPKLIVLDAEVTPAGMTQPDIERAHYWMGRKTREHFFPGSLKPRVWFYSATWWWDPQIGVQDWVVQDLLGWWMAAYRYNNGQPGWATPPTSVIPIGWPRWDAWQYTSKGTVPGIVGMVDLNLMQEEVFATIWGQAAPLPPPPEKLPIELRVPAGKTTVTITEV